MLKAGPEIRSYLLSHSPPPTISAVTVFGLQPRFGWPTTIMLAMFYASIIAGMFLRFEPAPIDTYHYWREVSESRVAPGDVVMITTKIAAKKLGCDAVLTRTWRDTAGNVIRIDRYEVPEFTSKFVTHELAATIPGGSNDGVLRMSGAVDFRCNPVQRLFGGTVFIFPDLYFLVTG